MHTELSPKIVWTPLWMVNTYYKFQINMFRSKRDITKCQKFLHDDHNDDAKAIVIPWVFSRNSGAKKITLTFDLDLGRWHRTQYQQMCIDEMYLHIKYKPCNKILFQSYSEMLSFRVKFWPDGQKE